MLDFEITQKDFNKLNYKITKYQLLYENYNDMECNNYCLIHFKFYAKDHQHFRRFKMIVNVDDYDLQEYFEEEYNGSKKQKLVLACIYADDIFNSYFHNEEDYYNEQKIKEFINYCNDTIEKYNNKVAY